MTNFTISDSELDAIKDQVVIVTGASSGIGLATTRRLIQHGVKVFASDINDLPEPEKSRVPFLKTDVSSWAQQVALFKAAKQKYGHINHVFANAGIAPKTTLLEDEVNENGDLLPPILTTININLIGVLYTVKLAVYHIKQSPTGGSIVMTGSGSSFARFSPTDYTTSKHGVYGILRSMYENLHPKLPIRINAVAPSWTDTSIVPRELIDVIGSDKVQSPDVVARSVVCLMADRERHGQMVYSDRGEFWDIETGENG
ncbi:NAD(P)-binding protein [Polyplosphaeria fusca]|uniref:NAD(P)-binding protein n=1 Tax=Polyplosphaeria fusca TaxID=682080 RepID=A0A9P4UZ94_9PLEO|nr:NAD(P)-binding protein [Polyplosphaeria fusca]